MSQADKYEDRRFGMACPTCGQKFLEERVDLLTAALQNTVMLLVDGMKLMPHSSRARKDWAADVAAALNRIHTKESK